MIRAFLTDRAMSVRVNSTLSAPLHVQGGSPQGSVLGSRLFCIVIDQMQDCVTNEVHTDVTPDMQHNGLDVSTDNDTIEERQNLSPIERPDPHDLELESDWDGTDVVAGDFLYFRPRNRIEDTQLSIRYDQRELNEYFGIPQGWTERPLAVKMYVDDMNSVEKVSYMNAVSVVSTGKRILIVHSPKTQLFFENVSVRALEIGMRVNQAKTQLLCISASNEIIKAYIRPRVAGGTTETESTSELKILGFWFGDRPGVGLHIMKTCEKFRGKLWSMRHLKRSGMKESDLLETYCVVLRPIIEYACVTYDSLLTQEQANELERLQLRALKVVYGPTVSYREGLIHSGIKTLSDRRRERVEKFALKNSQNWRVKEKWFPPAPHTIHDTRHKKKYLEEKSKTKRLYNSPIFTLRRTLNRLTTK